jgi:hypothetical protein
MHLSTLTIRKAEMIFMINIKEAEFYWTKKIKFKKLIISHFQNPIEVHLY